MDTMEESSLMYLLCACPFEEEEEEQEDDDEVVEVEVDVVPMVAPMVEPVVEAYTVVGVGSPPCCTCCLSPFVSFPLSVADGWESTLSEVSFKPVVDTLHTVQLVIHSKKDEVSDAEYKNTS
jgi:hypothetical protein